MTHETADALLDYCRDEVEEDLRAVIRYSREDYEAIYLREDMIDDLDIDDETLGMFRQPVFRMHQSAQALSQFHALLDDPEVMTYSYGDISIITFPLTEEEGILVSLECQGRLPSAFISHCESITSGSS